MKVKIRKFNEDIDHSDVDPFGEENWNEEHEMIEIKDLKKGDKIIIHKHLQHGDGLGAPVTFLKYNKWWDWLVVDLNGKELKISMSQNPYEDKTYIEKINEK